MFDYAREIYSKLNEDFLNSSLSVNATIMIKAEEVLPESIGSGMHDVLDGRQTTILKRKYPLDLLPYYRKKMFLTDNNNLKKSDNYKYKEVGYIEDYDLCLSIFKKEIAVRSNNTLIDFAENIQIKDTLYHIKASVDETFGVKPITHIFLSKETEI